MCHQTVSLTARALEQAGIATVVIGSAYDIVTCCGVPRFLFNDLPLGNPLGIPGDRDMQHETVKIGLELVASAKAPGTVVQTPFKWSDDESWKDNYGRVDDSNREALKRMGEENRRRRVENREKGLTRQ